MRGAAGCIGLGYRITYIDGDVVGTEKIIHDRDIMGFSCLRH